MEKISKKAIKVFLSYAHEDEALLKKLKTHLTPLLRSGKIETWYDQDISAGSQREQEIITHLNTAQIILLLVSPDFFASENRYGFELKRALELDERKEARVIPIILRPCLWQETTLRDLQALPTDAMPVVDRSWKDYDEALLDVARGILDVVDAIIAQRSAEKVNNEEELNTPQSLREIDELEIDDKKQIQTLDDYTVERWKIPQSGKSSITFLCCYAHNDEMLLNDLRTNLYMMMRPGLIKTWFNYDTSAQMTQEREISAYIKAAQIILILISPDFINSYSRNEVEMASMLEQHNRGQAQVIPVLLHHCSWKNTPLGILSPLPKDGIAVMDPFWGSYDMALIHLVKEIRDLTS